MTPVPFPINHRAYTGFTTLEPQEREAIKTAIEPLMHHPEPEWPAHGAIRLASDEPLYLLKVDRSLRAFVQPTPDGRPELLDLIRHETIQFLMRDQAPNGAPSNPVPSAT